MENFILLHKYNGKVISRFDFGEDLAEAINYIFTIIDNCHQVGEHKFEVNEEFSGRNFFNKECTINW